MATLETNSLFIRWKFANPQEETGSRLLTTSQKQGIQNILCDLAEEKVRITPTFENPIQAQFEQEFIRGQIEILRYLLSLSEAVEDQQKNPELDFGE